MRVNALLGQRMNHIIRQASRIHQPVFFTTIEDQLKVVVLFLLPFIEEAGSDACTLESCMGMKEKGLD